MSQQFQPTAADVATDVTLECLDATGHLHTLEATLGFRRPDPYAVTLTFSTSDGALVWTFGRALLLDGMYRPVGDGDVRIAPGVNRLGRAVTLIHLASPDGELLLEARSDQLSAFLARSIELVPEGEETHFLDVDLMVQRLLS